MTRWLAILAATVAAGAVAQPPRPNPYSQRLAKLPELQRLAAMRRAVLDVGQYCKRPELAVRKGPYRNLDMWSLRCDRGADYGVFIGPDGTVQVRPCRDLAQLKLPLCNLPPRKR